MMATLRRISLVALLGAGVISGSGYASSSASDAEVVNPAIVERQFEPEQTPTSQEVPLEKVVRSAPAPQEDQAIHFQLNRVNFTGGTVFSDTRLQKLVAPFVGKKVSVEQVYKLTAQITRLYRDEGYLLSRAVLPPQEIKRDGAVTIQLVEGYVSSVRFEGDATAVTPLIRSYADKIKQSRPLKAQDLERYLLLMRDIPGREVEAVLKPSAEQPQASDLVLVVKKKIIQGFLGANNEGSRALGPWMGVVGAAANSILDRGDQLTAQGAMTKQTRELKYGHVGYSQYVGTEGTKVFVEGTSMRTQAGDRFKATKQSGRLKSADAGVSHAFVRSRAESVYAGVKFSTKNSETILASPSTVPGILRRSEDKLRVFTLNATYDMADSLRGINLLNAELSRGVKGFGAVKKNSPLKTRPMGRPDFTKLNLTASRLQGLWSGFSLYAVVDWQQSFNPLLTPERFSFGGPPNFKAYANGPLTGDSGIKEKFELRYSDDKANATYLPDFMTSYQLYGFWGAGTAWNRKLTPGANERKRTSAGAYGGGLRLVLFEKTHASLEYTVPQRKRIGQLRNRSGVYLNVMQQF